MEERKWEDMTTDCLVNIFDRLDIESRLLDIPLVCKPWSQALRDPLCWQQLVLPDDYDDYDDYDDSTVWSSYEQYRNKLFNFIVSKSQRCATSIVLSDDCSIEALLYISVECPALKMLELPKFICDRYSDIIPSLVEKWKNLEFLSLGSSSCVVEILEHIFIHLRKFIGLSVTSGDINKEIVSTIVSKLPKLKYLTISHAELEKENLILILQGCKELVSLDVRDCIGFDEDDEDILKLSSLIKNFQCDGSTAEYDYGF